MDVTAADIHGPWVDPGWDSGLVERVRRYWSAPITNLPNAALTLFLRQQIAVEPVLTEARWRLTEGMADDSELSDGELGAAVSDAESRANKLFRERGDCDG